MPIPIPKNVIISDPQLVLHSIHFSEFEKNRIRSHTLSETDHLLKKLSP